MSQRFQPAAVPTPGPGEAVLRTRVICGQTRARSARVADDVAVIPRSGETGSVRSVAARVKRAGLAAMTMQGR